MSVTERRNAGSTLWRETQSRTLMKAAVFWPVTSGDVNLEPGLRRPAVFITENHTKHERNVKQDACFITSTETLFILILTWWSRNSNREFQRQFLRTHVTLWNNNWLQSTLDQNHRSVLRFAFFLMRKKHSPHLVLSELETSKS